MANIEDQDLEAHLIPEEQAPSTTQNKVTKAVRVLGCLTITFAICSAIATQFITADDKIYWSNFTIMAFSWILVAASIALFCYQAKVRGAEFHWPRKGALWPINHRAYPDTPYLGSLYEILGIAFGLCQITTTTATFALKHLWNMGPIRFSLIPVALAAIGLARSFSPTIFEPIYDVMMSCRGEIHTYTGRVSGGSIDGNCNAHHEEMANTTQDSHHHHHDDEEDEEQTQKGEGESRKA